MEFSKNRIKKKKDHQFEVKDKRGILIYLGDLKDKKPDGYGEYFFKKKNYKGYWKDGYRHGIGISNYRNGDIHYNGFWKYDVPNGKGIYFYPKNRKKYIGFLKDGLFHDEGVLYYENGNIKYRGNFLTSKFNGYGVYYNQNGYRQYEGYWKNNKKNGNFKEFNKNENIIFEGEFKNDKKDGYGYVFQKNFPVKYNLWKNGKIIPKSYKPFPKNLIFQKKIGEGGFGNIYLYKNKKNGKLYAVKSLTEDKKNDERHLIMQNRNLEYLKKKKLCKPYFLCPYGIYKDGKNLKLVLNFLDGYETFKKFRKKPLSLEKKKKICSQMFLQLNILHRIGMIHSDIKSDNIMVHPKTLKVRIIDFGVAIITDNKSEDKKYEVYGLTKRYFHLNLHGKYTLKELKKNDLKAISKIIYPYLSGNHKNVSFSQRFSFIDKVLFDSRLRK